MPSRDARSNCFARRLKQRMLRVERLENRSLLSAAPWSVPDSDVVSEVDERQRPNPLTQSIDLCWANKSNSIEFSISVRSADLDGRPERQNDEPRKGHHPPDIINSLPPAEGEFVEPGAERPAPPAQLSGEGDAASKSNSVGDTGQGTIGVILGSSSRLNPTLPVRSAGPVSSESSTTSSRISVRIEPNAPSLAVPNPRNNALNPIASVGSSLSGGSKLSPTLANVVDSSATSGLASSQGNRASDEPDLGLHANVSNFSFVIGPLSASQANGSTAGARASLLSRPDSRFNSPIADSGLTYRPNSALADHFQDADLQPRHDDDVLNGTSIADLDEILNALSDDHRRSRQASSDDANRQVLQASSQHQSAYDNEYAKLVAGMISLQLSQDSLLQEDCDSMCRDQADAWTARLGIYRAGSAWFAAREVGEESGSMSDVQGNSQSTQPSWSSRLHPFVAAATVTASGLVVHFRRKSASQEKSSTQSGE